MGHDGNRDDSCEQVFLMGICLPMYAIHSSNKSWDTWDSIAAFTCMTGIVIAYFADTQLYEFVQNNESLKEKGGPVILTLDKGLWRYSRHPNYIGEQLWWWGLFIFAWNVGEGWMFVGPLVNTLCLAYVTVLVEDGMLRMEYRAEAYRKYQKSTSVWIPWFRFSTGMSKPKKSMKYILGVTSSLSLNFSTLVSSLEIKKEKAMDNLENERATFGIS